MSGQLSSALPVGAATTTVVLADGTSHAVSGNDLALMIATFYKVVSTNASGSSDKLSGHGDEMKDPGQTAVVVGVTYRGVAALIELMYDKGYVEQGVGDAPTTMRVSPNKALAGGRNIMQPGRVVAAVDGWTDWDHWHPHERTKPNLDGVNADYPTDPYDGPWLDTMGPESTQGQQWWAGSGHTAGTLITDAQWVALGNAMLDVMQAVLGASVYIAINGVRGGGIADDFANYAGHADQLMWEGWLDFGMRTNLADRMTDAQFVESVNAALAVQQAGKNFEGLCYFNDSVATSVKAGGTPLRKAQEYQVCAQLLASNDTNGGHLTHQMGVGSGDPWATGEMCNPLYLSFRVGNAPTGASRLGAPVDHYFNVTSQRVASDGSGGYLYKRKYANGYVVVSTSTSKTLSYTVTQSQKHFFTGALIGKTITLGPGAHLITLNTAAAPPACHITAPTDGAVLGSTSQIITASASDPTGLAAVECRVDGGAYAAMTAGGGGSYSHAATLAAGAHTINVRATNSAGLQTVDTVHVTVNVQAPTVVIHGPSGTVTHPGQLIQVAASDPDGVGSAEYSLNGGPALPLAFNGGSGYWEAMVSLTPGANSIRARATDSNAAPRTSAWASGTVTLQVLQYDDRRGSCVIGTTPDSRSIYTAMPWLKVIGVTVNWNSIWPVQASGPAWPQALKDSFIQAKQKGYKILLIPQAGVHAPTWAYGNIAKVLTKLDSSAQPVTPQPVYWDTDYYTGSWRGWYDAAVTFLKGSLGDGSADKRDKYCAGLVLTAGSDIGYDMSTLAEAANRSIWDAATSTTASSRGTLMATVWTSAITHALANRPDCPIVVPLGNLHGDNYAFAQTVGSLQPAAFEDGSLVGMALNLIEQASGDPCGSQTVVGDYAAQKPNEAAAIDSIIAVSGHVILRLAPYTGSGDQQSCFLVPNAATEAALADACDSYAPYLKILAGSLANYQSSNIGAAHPWPVETYAKNTIQPRLTAGT
jgi:hypothetical protein